MPERSSTGILEALAGIQAGCLNRLESARTVTARGGNELAATPPTFDGKVACLRSRNGYQP